MLYILILSILYLGFILYREYMHQKEIRNLSLLIKANNPDEYDVYKQVSDYKPVKPKKKTEEEIPVEEIRPTDKIVSAYAEE